MKMLRITTVLVYVFISAMTVSGQWMDNFDDGDFTTNPVWTVDVSDFIVNDAKQLQLNASAAGESTLISAVSFPDSVRWSGYTMYDFSPSNNNRGAIYLALDNQDLATANGYVLRFGENGADDAISLIRVDGGSETELAVGTLGAVATAPTEFSYRITRRGNGEWKGQFAYGGGALVTDFTVNDNTYPLNTMQYFGVYAKYTSSNTEKVFYDDLVIEEDLPDSTPPTVDGFTIIDTNQIEVQFSEEVAESSATNVNNYVINPGNITPTSVDYSSSNPSVVTLNLNPALAGSVAYTLTVSQVTDVAGNSVATTALEFFIPSAPTAGDLKLSEILFDPFFDQEDFVEIYNASQKYVSLAGVFIRNLAKDETDYLDTDMILAPGQYLAISKDTVGLKSIYLPIESATFLQNDIPSFNNGDGNFSLGYTSGGSDQIFESFSYYESDHSEYINDSEGVSLERIDFDLPSDDANNWKSGRYETNHATPGYANAASMPIAGQNIEEGDLLLTEILFNPDTSAVDYVEVYNNSDKTLDLNYVFVRNADKGETKYIFTSTTLAPQQYLAICEDTTRVKNHYNVPSEANFLLADIPSFNAGDGNVTIGIYNGTEEVVLQSYDYDEDHHLSLLDEPKGVSLERISLTNAVEDSNNWISASSSSNYGTPGYANSGNINFTPQGYDFVYLKNKTFSPNGDGDTELLEVLFEMDKAGYLATVQVYDMRGQLKRTLASNQLLSTQDFVLWDGQTDDGQRANIGIYVILVKAFHTDGETKESKLTCVLADFLD